MRYEINPSHAAAYFTLHSNISHRKIFHKSVRIYFTTVLRRTRKTVIQSPNHCTNQPIEYQHKKAVDAGEDGHILHIGKVRAVVHPVLIDVEVGNCARAAYFADGKHGVIGFLFKTEGETRYV